MQQERSNEQHILEIVLIIVVLGVSCLLHVMPRHKMVILHLYYLPVALGGFYLGRYRSGVMALLCAISAVFVTIIHASFLNTELEASATFLAIMVWGAVMGLTTMLIGTLSDDRRRKLLELHESHKLDTLADALTGVANRRAFQYELTRRMTEWHRQQTPLALILVDVDHFKKFNDTYGHQAGDSILRDVANVIRVTVREVDLVARYGGEEFGVILPNTSLHDAKEAAERLRRVIETTRFECTGFKSRLTVSVGVAHVMADDDAALLVDRADAALYASKQAGRNCAHFHNGKMCEHFGASLPSPPAEQDKEVQKTTSVTDAYTDAVTGVPTRKVFNEELRRRVSEAQRYDSQLSIMFVRVDQFDRIDGRGPQAGDMVVAATAEFIRAALRDSDLVTRYSKSQFAILLPVTPLSHASIPAERIRKRVTEYESIRYRGSPMTFSVSIGLAELANEEDAGQFLKRVELAVDAASDCGGNRVCAHNGSGCEPVVGEALV